MKTEKWECRFSDHLAQRINAEMGMSGNISLERYITYIQEIRDSCSKQDSHPTLVVRISDPDVVTSRSGKQVVNAWLSYSWVKNNNDIDVTGVCGFTITEGKISSVYINGEEENERLLKGNKWKPQSDNPSPAPQIVPSSDPLPFVIKKCSVENIDSGGNLLPFDAANSRYLRPTIEYECTTSGSYDIYVKLFKDSESMYTFSGSPFAFDQQFTQINKGVVMSTGINHYTLKGFGNDDPGHYPAGGYRYEFWYNGRLLYDYRFNIPESTTVTPTPSPVTIPVTKPSIDDKNEFYVEPNLRVGALSSIGFSVGGYLNNINMELAYGVGFGKSDDIYWCDDILWPAKCSYSPKTNLSLKVGYGFALSEKFWITPQTGIYYTRLSCKVDKDFVPPSLSRKFINNASNYATGANCTSLVISARLSADFTDHFGISFTPEWQLGMKKSSGYEKLSDVSSKINKWSKGLNVKFGIVLTF